MKIPKAELQRIVKMSEEQSRISGGINKLNRKSFRIPKYRLEANTKQVFFIPLSLCLPFNPFELQSDVYSEKNPFVFKTSVETAWAACSQLMRENPEVKKTFEDYLGTAMDEAEYEKTGAELAALLSSYRNIDPSVEYVCSTTMEAFGEYGRTGAVQHEIDADGIIHYSGILYDLSALEMAIIAPELKEFNKSIQKGGSNAAMNKKQRTAARQAIRSKLLVDMPRPYAVLRILAFKAEGDYIAAADSQTFVQEKSLSNFSFWMTVNQSKIAAFRKQLGSKSDIYPSYVEYEVDTASSEPMRMWDEASKLVVRSDFYTDKLNEKLPEHNFAQLYEEYRSNDSIWSDQTLINSVDAFKPIEDNLLLEAYASSVKKYDRAVFRAEIVDRFGDVIRQVSEELADQLENDFIKERLSQEEVALDKDDITAFLAEDTANGFEDGSVPDTAAEPMEDIGSDVVLPNFNN